MMFKRLYQKIDGEKGAYRGKITPHSMRKYFRTHLVKTCDLDIVEHLMRHTGYLSGSYVRITDEDIRKQFHEGEHVLYLTRADHRIQTGKLDAQTREIKTLKSELQAVKTAQAQVEQERTAIRAAGTEYVRADEMQRAIEAAVAAALKK